MKFTVGEIAEATGGEILAGSAGAPAGRIVTDTRTLGAGETFLALRGPKFDGHDFLVQAVERGARCLVIERGRAPMHIGGGELPCAIVAVDDTLEALASLARAVRKRLACPVIAVTGSAGKTTLKEMLGHVLGRRLKGRMPPASFNNLVGVPLTLLRAEPDDEFVLCELGTNAPGEIARLADVTRPTIGVVTLVAAAHLEGLGSVEGVAAEKSALVAALPSDGVAVLNADDERVAAMAQQCRGRVVTFGIDNSADLRARDVIQTEQGVQFSVGGPEQGEEVGFALPVLGRHQVLLALAAAAVARELGIPLEETAESLQGFRPPPMRLAVDQVGGIVLVNDAYNASPESMRVALNLLRLWPERRRVFFCGDMLELGRHSAAAHAALGRAAVEAGVKRLICVGRETERTAESAVAAGLAAEAVTRYGKVSEAAAEAPSIVRTGDVVLVKGSRAMQMEQVSDAIADALR